MTALIGRLFRASALFCVLVSSTACSGYEIKRTQTFSYHGPFFDSTKVYPKAYSHAQNSDCKKDCQVEGQLQVERDEQSRHVHSGFAIERTIVY
jgi:hypothetical protein